MLNMLKRINGKAVLLKIIYGAVLGGISSFYLFADVFKIGFKSNIFFVFGIIAGFLGGLASVPFRIKKIEGGVISGIIAGTFLFLINLTPIMREKDALLYLFLPTYSLFLSIAFGIIDESAHRIIAGIIGGLIASLISFAVLMIGSLITLSILWGNPGVYWPLELASIITGSIMLLGIGAGECFERKNV